MKAYIVFFINDYILPLFGYGYSVFYWGGQWSIHTPKGQGSGTTLHKALKALKYDKINMAGFRKAADYGYQLERQKRKQRKRNV